MECELSNGSSSTCYEITVVGLPADHDTGPFCPTTIETEAADAGVWLDGENFYEADGQFIADLAEIYEDENWQLFDEDGNVNITETAEEFELAARPDVDESLQNHCVEGRLEFLENGEPIPTTVTIPIQPQVADSASSGSGVLGVSLNGVRMDGAAPVDAILGAYTIATFDSCGGHYNPVEGYHMHAALDCSTTSVEDHAGQFAYALDGFAIYSHDETAEDLDECGGHSDDELGYHYHAAAPEDNLILSCFTGLVTTDNAGGGGPGGRPGGPPQ